MSETEVSRRCLACGVAVRARASFCPYCGEKLEAAASPPLSSLPESSPGAAEFDASRTQANFSATTQTPGDDAGSSVTTRLNEWAASGRTVPYISNEEMPVSSSLPPPVTPEIAPLIASSVEHEDHSATIAPTAPLPPIAARENLSPISSAGEATNEVAMSETNAPSQTFIASSSVAPAGQEEERAARPRTIAVRQDRYGEKSRPRAEKLRDRSAALIEEATDDPGLRFVLIALLLFIVFLVFLFFSQIIG